MILSNILQHVLVTRGYYFFFENREAYIKLLFHVANQLMLQKNIIRHQPERKKLRDYLENISNQIPGFFEGETLNGAASMKSVKQLQKKML